VKFSDFVNRWDAFEALGYDISDAWYMARFGHNHGFGARREYF